MTPKANHPDVKPFDRRAHCQQIGGKGGRRTAEIYGSKYMAAIGAEGFKSYADNHHDGNRGAALAALRQMHRPSPQPYKSSK